MAKATLEIDVLAKFNLPYLNKQIATAKKALGPLGEGVELIDIAALESELAQYEQVASELVESLEEIEDKLEPIRNPKGGSSMMEKLFAGEAITNFGEQLDSFGEKGAEANQSLREVAAQTGLVGDELDALPARAEAAFVAGVGGSVAEAAKQIGIAQDELGQFLDPEEIDAFTARAAGIEKVFGKSVEALSQGSRTLAANFDDLGGEDIGNLLALGFQKTGGKMDDLIDTTDEYSQHFAQMGFNAEEMFGLFTRAGELGARDLDKLADAAKEAKIRLDAGDTQNALADISSPITAAIQGIVQMGERGELTMKEVLQKTSAMTEEAFNAGQITDAIRGQLNTAIAGTPAEDIGTELYGRIFSAPIDVEQIRAQAALAGEQVQGAIGPVTMFDEIGKEIDLVTTKVSGALAPFISGAGGVLQTVGQITPGFAVLEEKFGIFEKGGAIMKTKLLPNILALIPGLGAQTVATGAATTATVGLNAAMLASPIGIFLGAIALGAGAWALFGDHTEDIATGLEGVSAAMDEVNKATTNATAVKEQSQSLRDLADEYDRLKNSTAPEDQRRFLEVAEELADKVPASAEAIAKLDASGVIVGTTYSIATDAVREFGAEQEKLAQEAKDSAMQALVDQSAELVDSYTSATEELESQRAEHVALKGLTAEEKELNDQLRNIRSSGLTSLTDAVGLTEDTVEREKELGRELSENSKKQRDAELKLREAVKLMQQEGKSAAEITKELGLTEDLAKLLGVHLTKSEAGAKGTADAADKIKTEVKSAAQAADDLAAAFNKTKSAANASLQSAVGAMAQLNAKRRQGIQLTEEEQEQHKAALEQGREAVRETNILTAAEKEANAALGIGIEKKEKKVKTEKTAFQIAQEKYRIEAQSLENAQAFIDIQNESNRLDEGRAETAIDELVTEQGKLDLLRKQRAEFDQLFKVNKKGQIGIKLKADERDDAEQMLTELNIALAEQANRIKEVKLKTGITIDDQAIRDLQEQRLRLNVETGVLDQSDLVDFLSNDITRMESELRDHTAKRVAFLQEYRSKDLISQEEYDRAILDLQTGNEQTQLEMQNRIDQRRKEKRDLTYSRELEALRQHHDTQKAAFDLLAAEAQTLFDQTTGAAEEVGSQIIEKRLNDQLVMLEDQHEQLIISEKTFEAQKLAAQEKAESDRQALQARSIGARLEMDRQAAIAALELQKGQLEEQRKLAVDEGRTADASALGKQIEGITTEITAKGDVLTAVAGELQGTVTDLMSNLFAGDEGDVKKPFKKAFSILVGALSKLASAKITEVVLSSIAPTGIPGLLAAFGARPAIEAIFAQVLGPLFSSLLSFSGGGRQDSKTLAWIGDASEARPGSDSEWILRDDQLWTIISVAIAEAMAPVITELRAMRAEIADLQFRLHLSGEDLSSADSRANQRKRRRRIPMTRLQAA